MTAQPADGTAIILHLIEAARAWRHCGINPVGPLRDLQGWVEQLETRYARERAEHGAAPVGWEPRRWRELVAGDTVEVGGVEAVIEGAVTLGWHVDPRSNEYRPQPLEHAHTAVRLAGRNTVYKMPPDGEVETLRGQAGQAVDEANGYRSALHEEEIDVMASWAGAAAETLEAAGLGPIEVIRP